MQWKKLHKPLHNSMDANKQHTIQCQTQNNQPVKHMRKELRIIGIDDGPFFKFRKGKVLIVGTIYRGGSFMDGLLTTTATVDGNDSTKQIANMINNSKKFKPQIRVIMLNGITVGGFNVIDLPKLSKLTKLPIIAVTRKYPDLETIYHTLENLGMKNKVKLIKQLPKPIKIGNVHVQHIGIDLERTKELLKLTTLHADVPEPLRIAHIIASGVVMGQSRGRA
ncbi:DUF99 family protein [Candidatus Woesearchaeota archaeon]|nr:DUF99 family protein [Candidatus Woesearchaeota archaeon]